MGESSLFNSVNGKHFTEHNFHLDVKIKYPGIVYFTDGFVDKPHFSVNVVGCEETECYYNEHEMAVYVRDKT